MITREELQELIGGIADINVINNVLSEAISGVNIQDELSVDDLKPTGELNDLIARLKNSTVINTENLERLLEIADQDIQKNSRLNSLFVMISSLAKTVKTNVLPLIVK
jgi:hypothetical protein